jgi:DNA modification methylase
MSETFLDGKVTLLRGDCLELLPTLEEGSIDSCVTDPPYHLTSIVKRFGSPNSAPINNRDEKTGRQGPYHRSSKGFMGKQWDGGDIAFKPELWAEVLRVLKPGAHLLAFSGTRTYHRMACAIEDAGFEIRDQIGWCYGSGFPKSHDISKAIDRAAGAEREVIGSYRAATQTNNIGTSFNASAADEFGRTEAKITLPATDQAIQWQGWGTALKPSFEPLVIGRKPFNSSQLFAMIGSTVNLLESRLWSMLSAKDAAKHFGLSQSELDAACASAQWSADDKSNTRATLSGQMAMSQFASALISSLSTVSLWKACLVANLSGESTSTTATASSTTIDPKIWNSCLSKITPDSIILAHRPGAWSSADASPAERYLSAAALRWNATRELSAAESALGAEPTLCQDAIDQIKPNWNSIVLARKPLSESSIASNVLKHGTGAINIDGCRIEAAADDYAHPGNGLGKRDDETSWRFEKRQVEPNKLGRWPANLIHDGSEEVLEGFPETLPCGSASKVGRENGAFGLGRAAGFNAAYVGDSGSAARFFYTAKADADDRLGSKHPTVKPLDLISYLAKLITPRDGLILDPFAGTGTCGEAAFRNGFRAILIEREPEYQADIVKRMGLCLAGPDERRAASVKQESVDDLPMFAGRG